jgi:site-specific DNA-cytosine methylase
MEREAGAERHLFTRQVDFFKVFKPRTAMIEQPPPSQPHMHEYTEVVEEMQRCGYNTTQKVLNCAEIRRAGTSDVPAHSGSEIRRAGAGGF